MKIFGVNKNSIEEDKEVHFTRERGVSRSGNNGDLIDVMEVTE